MSEPKELLASLLRRFCAACVRPADASGWAVFRMLWGLLMAYGASRYVLNGWVETLYDRPSFAFKFEPFEWVQLWPGDGLTWHFCVMVALALCVSAGLFYRVATVLFFFLHSYVELLDVSYYLNHHYLAVLVNLLLCFVPAHRSWSLDAWRGRRAGALKAPTLPMGFTYLLRFQLCIVYFHAGLAKLQSDWLLHAQPLNIWLSPLTDMAVIGPLLDELPVHYALSWSGFIYDTTIWAFLLQKRTRPWAYAVVVAFHSLTRVLFAIGLFPFIMVLCTTLFFEPNWPRALWARLRRLPVLPSGTASAHAAESARPRAPREPETAQPASRRTRWLLGCGVVYCVFQLLMPLRHYLLPGDVLWNEHGMRWSWKVMVREKSGSVTYRVVAPQSGRVFQVPAGRYLTLHQEREMAGQPDLIAQLARHVHADFERRGFGDVEVYADALVSLNGRAPARLFDPGINLAALSSRAEVARAVLPRPEGAPPQLRAAR